MLFNIFQEGDKVKKTCIFLLHGSRKPKEGEIEDILSSIELKEGMDSRVAYLELQEPSYSSILELSPDTDQFHILPLFVLEGRHVREDIPEITKELQAQAPDKEFILHDHLGQWELFKSMLNERASSF